ncbi:hypothetical protein Dcae01_03316 [Deinococcus caeni]|uniref:Bacteriophage tail tape measure N-terminal domain-containing protein n=2 Tax=Deinococcus caeni TaxID=569127 RepID=A0ABP9UHC0_9DEIO
MAGGIIDGIKKKLNIRSPSREMYILGEHASQGLADGIDQSSGVVKSASTRLAATVLDEVAKARAELEKGLALEAWRQSLATLDDNLLQVEGTLARSRGEADRYNAVLSEQATRASEAAREIDALVDAQIRAADLPSQMDPQGAADRSYRLSYGAGDVGLIRSLADATGRTVTQVRADVEAALAEAQRFAPEVARLIERVWSDALTHRRATAAEERRVNEALNASYAEQSAARIQLIQDQIKAEEAASVTHDVLIGQVDELLQQGRDPRQSGFITWLDELAKGEGEASEAAVKLKRDLDGVIAARTFALRLPDPSTAQDGPAAEARGVVRPATLDGPVSVVRPATLDGPVSARGQVTPTLSGPPARARVPEVTAEVKEWQVSTAAAIAAAEAVSVYRQSLKALTVAQLEEARATALAAGQQARYDVLTTELGERKKVQAESTKLISDAENELSTILTGKTLPAFESRAQALERQAGQDTEQRERLLELADAIRTAGQAAAENADALNVTVRVRGVETGMKALDLYRTAILAVTDAISQSFQDVVAGTSNGVQSILGNMAKMALGVVRAVAQAVIAYQAQAVALALLKGGTFDFVGAAAALAAAAAVAGIVAGLESRIDQVGRSSAQAVQAPAAASSSSAPIAQAAATTASNNVVIPTAQVNLVASADIAAALGRHIDRFGEAVDRFAERGVKVDVRTQRPPESRLHSLVYDLTGRL